MGRFRRSLSLIKHIYSQYTWSGSSPPFHVDSAKLIKNCIISCVRCLFMEESINKQRQFLFILSSIVIFFYDGTRGNIKSLCPAMD